MPPGASHAPSSGSLGLPTSKHPWVVVTPMLNHVVITIMSSHTMPGMLATLRSLQRRMDLKRWAGMGSWSRMLAVGAAHPEPTSQLAGRRSHNTFPHQRNLGSRR